jgi:alpha-tubulin suppressor-like RCC1 family protein
MALLAFVLAACTPLMLGETGASFTSSTSNGSNQMSAASNFTVGNLYLWGQDQSEPTSPLKYTSDSWSDVAAGNSHGCGIKTDATLWCWGLNGSGQLGSGTTDGLSHAPTQVGSSTWQAVSTANNHTCGIRVSGTLWCWGGDNGNGLLGINNTSDQSSPVQVGVATNWTVINTGEFSTCGMRGTALYCWGINDKGQLGQGTFTNHWTPVLVTGTWSAVNQSFASVCAVKTTGTLWCWGLNDHGQLGLGNTTDLGPGAHMRHPDERHAVVLG